MRWLCLLIIFLPACGSDEDFIGVDMATFAEQVEFLNVPQFDPSTNLRYQSGYVKVLDAGTSNLSTVYSARDKGGTFTNPFALDSDDTKEIYLDTGVYDFELYEGDPDDVDNPGVKRDTISGMTYGLSDNSVDDLLDGGYDKSIKVDEITVKSTWADVQAYGATGGADDTVAIQAALNSGASEIVFRDIDVITQELTVPTTVKRIVGINATITPFANLQKIFVGSGFSDLEITGLNFTGVASTFTASSLNGCIDISSSSNVYIHDNYISDFNYVPVYLTSCTESYVHNNRIIDCAGGIYYEGCSRGSICNNIVKGKYASGVFVVGVSLVSTNGGAAPCEDIVISDNEISGLLYSQAILAHAGLNVSIHGNTCNGCYIGISVNAFSGASATDLIENISIQGNTIDCEAASDTENTGEGINVAGGTNLAQNVSIIGNTIMNVLSHYAAGNNSLGGITLVKISNFTVSGNAIRDCNSSGIYINCAAAAYECSGMNISGNSVKDCGSSLVGSAGVRIETFGSSTGLCAGFIFNNVITGCQQGHRIDVLDNASSFVQITDNNFGTNTLDDTISQPYAVKNGNGLLTGYYTEGDTTPSVKGLRSLIITNSSPTTITQFDDGETGQIITLYFVDANTTVARSGSPALRLDGGVDFSSTNYDTLTLMNNGSNWVEISRTESS